MTPIESGGKVSLTKHYNIEQLAEEVGHLHAGMTRQAVTEALSGQHPELADDLFVFDDDDKLVEDRLIWACQAGAHESSLLVWTALLLSDGRLQEP